MIGFASVYLKVLPGGTRVIRADLSIKYSCAVRLLSETRSVKLYPHLGTPLSLSFAETRYKVSDPVGPRPASVPVLRVEAIYIRSEPPADPRILPLGRVVP